MTHFHHTFLLAIPYKEVNVNKVKKKKPESKKGKASKHGAEVESDVPEDYNVFPAGKPLFTCHVEYSMVPGILKYELDIVCWGKFAKVYSEDGVQALRTVIRGELCWISFCVSNSAVLMKTKLEELHDHKVTFNMWPTRNKLSQRAKGDVPSQFFTYLEDDATTFATAYEVPPSKTRQSSKFIEPKLTVANETKSYLKGLPYLEHEQFVLKIIEDCSAAKEVEEPVQESLTVNRKSGQDMKGNNDGKKNKGAKGKIGKPTKGDGSLTMSLDGETLFTDSAWHLCELKEKSPELLKFSVITSVKNLLTDKQRQLLNPLIIRVYKLKSLPVEILQKHRITSVYVSYNVLTKTALETTHKPIETDITFDEAHVIFTHQFSKTSLIQFIQTAILVMEVYGVQEQQPLIQRPSLFGQEVLDERLGSKVLCSAPRYNDVYGVLLDNPGTLHLSAMPLAVAHFDLSSLMQGCHFVELTQPLHAFPNSPSDGNKDAKTILELNLPSRINIGSGPLNDFILCENRSRLKACIKLMAPLHVTLMHTLASQDVFNRIFVVLKDKYQAMKIINGIYAINQSLLGACTVVPDHLKMGPTLNIPDNQSPKEKPPEARRLQNIDLFDENEDLAAAILKAERGTYGSAYYCQFALTGFIIDSFDKVLIFVEGQSNGQLQQVWNSLMNLPRSKGRVYYNSELVFQNRIYSQFLVYGGMFVVTLHEQLDKKLAQYALFLEGNIPQPCWRALKQLDLLLKAYTIQSAFQKNLFPSASDLLSLSLEFGVPFHLRSELKISSSFVREVNFPKDNIPS